MAERKGLSKRTRFEVFKRDGFTCQYCGRVPPIVMLNVDHIIPVAGGGDNDEGNLVTSCFDCNAGKSDIPLNVAPESLTDRASRIEEMEAQLAGYREIVQVRKHRIDRDVSTVARLIYGNDVETITRATYVSLKTLLSKLPMDEVEEAADIAAVRFPDSEYQRFKYFCGICWRKIKGPAEPEVPEREPDELDRMLAKGRRNS